MIIYSKLISFKFVIADGANKPDYVEDFLRPCRVQIKMKMSVVCVRDDEPDKIIGFNLNYVSLPNNTILADAIQAVRNLLLFNQKTTSKWNFFKKNYYFETGKKR